MRYGDAKLSPGQMFPLPGETRLTQESSSRPLPNF